MAKITLRHLEAFVAVTDLAGFARAAEKLNTTQPGISARIAALEEQLRTRLLDRHAGGVRLTPAGEMLLPRARAVLAAADDFLMAAGDDLLIEGTLRLGVSELVVHTWLADFLSALKARFPNIDVDLTVDLSANLSDALFAHALDLTLQNGPFTRAAPGTLALGEFAMIWVASPSLGYGDRALSLADLTTHPLLTYARGTPPYQQVKDHVDGAREVQARLVSSTNIAACMHMTRSGLGVACLPRVMVAEDIATGRMEALRYDWTPDPLSFHARWHAPTGPAHVGIAAQLAAGVARGRADANNGPD